MAKIRIGLIGYGSHMKEKLIPAIKILKELGYEIEIVAIAKRTKAGLEDSSIPIYTNFVELLDKKIVDALVVALPDPELHEEIALLALERGIHVFVEKPLTVNMNKLDILLQDARMHPKIITAVGFNFAFASVLEQAREQIQNSHGDLTINCAVKNYDPNPKLHDVVKSGINFALIHSVSVAVDLLGEPEDVQNISLQPIEGKPDCFTLQAELIYPDRKVMLIYNNDASGFKLTVDYAGKTLDLTSKDKISSGEFKGISLRQAQYVEELKSFFDAIKSGKQGKYSFLDPNMQIVHRLKRFILVKALEQLQPPAPRPRL